MKVEGDYHVRGFAVVRQLLPKEVCHAFLNQLAKDMAASGSPLGHRFSESPVLRRAAVELYGYHYRPMLMLLWALTPTVAHLASRDLLPSYDYFRIYREGDTCRVHSDRHACQHSLSLTLDYSDGVSWPLDFGRRHHSEPDPHMVDGFDGDAFDSVEMEPGDAVLYQGANYRHGRVTPNPNGWSAHLFLHWVERDGPYAGAAFESDPDATRPLNLSFA